MDPIADMLTQIRNSLAVGHKSCLVRYSKIKEEIARVLKEEEYIRNYRVEEKENPTPATEKQKNGKKNIRISLSYDRDGSPSIRNIRRISKPGRRVYYDKERLPIVLKGIGIVIVSTNKGLMSNNKARKEGLGGEIICEVY